MLMHNHPPGSWPSSIHVLPVHQAVTMQDWMLHPATFFSPWRSSCNDWRCWHPMLLNRNETTILNIFLVQYPTLRPPAQFQQYQIPQNDYPILTNPVASMLFPANLSAIL